MTSWLCPAHSPQALVMFLEYLNVLYQWSFEITCVIKVSGGCWVFYAYNFKLVISCSFCVSYLISVSFIEKTNVFYLKFWTLSLEVYLFCYDNQSENGSLSNVFIICLREAVLFGLWAWRCICFAMITSLRMDHYQMCSSYVWEKLYCFQKDTIKPKWLWI